MFYLKLQKKLFPSLDYLPSDSLSSEEDLRKKISKISDLYGENTLAVHELGTSNRI